MTYPAAAAAGAAIADVNVEGVRVSGEDSTAMDDVRVSVGDVTSCVVA